MSERMGGPEVARGVHADFRDDRGTKLTFARTRGFLARLGLRRSRARRLGERALAVAFVGAIASFAVYDVRRNGWPTASDVVPFVVAIGLLYAGTWSWWWLRTRGPILKAKAPPRLASDRATALAWGHCGACGACLRDRVADEDGCVACPTCAAAWHSDRWTRGTILEAEVAHAAYADEEKATDARGVTLRPGVFSREVWLTPNPLQDASPEAVPSRRQRRIAARRAMDRVRTRWLIGIALVAAPGFLILAWLFSWIENHLQFNTRPLFPLSLVWLGMCALPFARTRSNRAYSLASLGQSLCPNCGMVLSASARVEFDGCVSCAHCGRAWKACDVGQPEPGPEPGPEPEIEPNAAFLSFANKLGRTIGRQGHGDV